MNKKYKASVNNTFEFEFDSKEINSLDVRKTAENKFHVLKDNRSCQAKILAADFYNKKYSVQINSNPYEIEISDELDLLIEKMGLSLGAAQVVNNITAPMPGLIIQVNIEEGSEVKEGDALLILEAMKMENSLSAPRDGVVKSIQVKQGQTVEKNQLLIEME